MFGKFTLQEAFDSSEEEVASELLKLRQSLDGGLDSSDDSFSKRSFILSENIQKKKKKVRRTKTIKPTQMRDIDSPVLMGRTKFEASPYVRKYTEFCKGDLSAMDNPISHFDQTESNESVGSFGAKSGKGRLGRSKHATDQRKRKTANIDENSIPILRQHNNRS